MSNPLNSGPNRFVTLMHAPTYHVRLVPIESNQVTCVKICFTIEQLDKLRRAIDALYLGYVGRSGRQPAGFGLLARDYLLLKAFIDMPPWYSGWPYDIGKIIDGVMSIEVYGVLFPVSLKLDGFIECYADPKDVDRLYLG